MDTKKFTFTQSIKRNVTISQLCNMNTLYRNILCLNAKEKLVLKLYVNITYVKYMYTY